MAFCKFTEFLSCPSYSPKWVTLFESDNTVSPRSEITYNGSGALSCSCTGKFFNNNGPGWMTSHGPSPKNVFLWCWTKMKCQNYCISVAAERSYQPPAIWIRITGHGVSKLEGWWSGFVTSSKRFFWQFLFPSRSLCADPRRRTRCTGCNFSTG